MSGNKLHIYEPYYFISKGYIYADARDTIINLKEHDDYMLTEDTRGVIEKGKASFEVIRNPPLLTAKTTTGEDRTRKIQDEVAKGNSMGQFIEGTSDQLSELAKAEFARSYLTPSAAETSMKRMRGDRHHLHRNMLVNGRMGLGQRQCPSIRTSRCWLSIRPDSVRKLRLCPSSRPMTTSTLSTAVLTGTSPYAPIRTHRHCLSIRSDSVRKLGQCPSARPSTTLDRNIREAADIKVAATLEREETRKANLKPNEQTKPGLNTREDSMQDLIIENSSYRIFCQGLFQYLGMRDITSDIAEGGTRVTPRGLIISNPPLNTKTIYHGVLPLPENHDRDDLEFWAGRRADVRWAMEKYSKPEDEELDDSDNKVLPSDDDEDDRL